MRNRLPPNVPWRTTALLCALVAVTLPLAARAVAGPKGAKIHVAWQPSVGDAERERLEAQYHLADSRKLVDTYTWGYDLTDASEDNIRALVDEPAARDTHEVDRHTYTVSPTATRTARRQRFAAGGDALVGAADGLACLMLAFAAGLAATRTSLRHLLRRGIPEIDAATAGMFRIVFGSAVLAFFAIRPVDASWLSVTFDLEIEGRMQAAALDWLRMHSALADLIMPWLFITGIAFTCGVFTRFSYALFVAGVLTWAFVRESVDSIHPLGALVVTLVALLPSRWGDAWSVDAWLGRTRPASSPTGLASSHYGYSVWIPGLVLGVGFAAAAWAKLTAPPTVAAWVLNGTIKYHFITDSSQAAVDWGLQLARHPWLAILASFFAVATEALAVSAAFTRSERFRLLMGTATASLIVGFRVFMGVLWPAWWVLLLGFLPWQRIGATLRVNRFGVWRPPAAAPDAPITRRYTGARVVAAVQVATIAAILGQQVISSAARVELAPMFSWYPMYSTTYASPAEFDAQRAPRYRIMASTAQGAVELNCDSYDEFVRQFQDAIDGSPEAAADVWHALRSCGVDLATVRDVTLQGELRVFDWDRLVFTSRPAAALGPLRRGARETASLQTLERVTR